MRERRTAIFAIAVSPEKLADEIGILPREVIEAIKNDLLPCYRKGLRRRVLVRDAERWIENTWPRVRIAAQMKTLKGGRHGIGHSDRH